MERRDFLFLRPGHTARPLELDCSQLYLRYLDSLDDQTSDDLFDVVTRELRGGSCVRVTQTDYLARDDFRCWLMPLLDSLPSQGCEVVLAARTDS